VTEGRPDAVSISRGLWGNGWGRQSGTGGGKSQAEYPDTTRKMLMFSTCLTFVLGSRSAAEGIPRRGLRHRLTRFGPVAWERWR